MVSTVPESVDDERGLGLIEVMVAMFLLVVIALTMIPALATSLSLSRQNAMVGRAAQLANQRLSVAVSAAQANPTQCSAAVAGLNVPDWTPVSDPSGAVSVGLAYMETVSGTCPASGAGVITVSVSVAASDDTAHPLVTTSTRLAFLAAS